MFIINYVKMLKKKRKAKKIYRRNLREYIMLNTMKEFAYSKEYKYPIYWDRFEKAGSMGCYFWQDLWASKLIFKNNPKKHFDIGSRIDGFIGHLASFRDNIVMIDVRPIDSKIPGVEFVCDDATMLRGIRDESIESLSALCSLEHFGLGRYGDMIDPEACFKAFHSIVRVIKKGGHVYVSVPIGREHLEFDAHRVFYAKTIVNEFYPMELIEFSCVCEDDIEIEQNVPLGKYDDDLSKGGNRFGLFHFVKK